MLVLASGKDRALSVMQNHRYMSTEHGDFRKDPDATQHYVNDLKREVGNLLYAEMRKHGVLSLAQRWNCPLMWSHYGDEHRGLCIEYVTTDHHCASLMPVNYGGSGDIKISDIYRWKVEKSADAESTIRKAFFHSKAPDWRYEREWRDVAKTAGPRESTLKSISAVYFGMRCDPAVSTAVVMLFSKSPTPIKFFDIYRRDDSFRLHRTQLDDEDIRDHGLRTPMSWEFEILPELTDTGDTPALES